jgi:biotin carboxylase
VNGTGPHQRPGSGPPGTTGLAGARILLLVPAQTYRAADFLTAAHRMGLHVVVGSDGALPLGGHPVLHADPRDPEHSAVQLASRAGPVDAVVAVDTPMLALAAAVAARIGLPHNPTEAVRAATDKAAQRRLWAAAGVPQPAFRIVPAGAGEPAVAAAAAAVGFPCMVKAVSLSASQGVLRADDETGAIAAASRVRGVLAGAGRPAHEPLIVEEYLPGPEVSIDGLLIDGCLAVTAVFDKPDTPDGPTFEETILVTPCQLPQPVLAAAIATAGRAARALGLRHGPIHAELRTSTRQQRQEPAMLELAARSIGGLCARALRFTGGVSLEQMVLAAALGHPPAPPRLDRACGVLMLHAEQAGTLRAIDGKAQAAAVPGITGLTITAPLGQHVRPLPDSDQYLGFIFAEAGTPQDAAAALRTARSQLRVIIQ